MNWNANLRPARNFSGVALAMALTASAHSAQAQNPALILKKTQDLYANAKSFSGELKIVQTGQDQAGKSGTVNSSQKISFKAPNRFKFEVTATGSGVAADAGKGNRTMTCDGATLYTYIPAQKQYMKNPAPPSFSLLQVIGRLLPQPDQVSASLGGELNVNGHAALRLNLKMKMPTLPPNVPADQRKKLEEAVNTAKPIEVIVDKKTYELLSVSASGKGTSIKVTVASQALNGAVSEGSFKFSPPAGSKEFVPPQAPSGAPGGLTPPGRKP